MARCLFVISDIPWTGRARALVSAATGLAGHGHIIQLMAPDRSAAQKLALGSTAGLEVLRLPALGRQAGAARVRALRQALRESDADVVFVHTDGDHLAAALAMTGLPRRPALVRRYAIGERSRPSRVGRIAERLAVAIQLLTGRQGIERADFQGPTFRVELGVPIPAAPANEVPPPHPILACVYDCAMTMHASRVLRAVTMLRKRHRDLTLCMIATGEVPERLRMQAAALGLSRVVRWLTMPVGVADVLAQSASMVVAASGDDAAYATLDGMAYGIPVVAPRGSLFERYVANGISGILLDRFDTPACAAALATLVSDPDRRIAMGGAGHARAAREFSEHEYLTGLESLLRSLATSESAQPVAAA